MVHNLTWSGVYLERNLQNALLQKLLSLVPLTETVTEVYVATMDIVISDSYDTQEDNMNHLQMIKLKIHLGENVTYYCNEILIYAK